MEATKLEECLSKIANRIFTASETDREHLYGDLRDLVSAAKEEALEELRGEVGDLKDEIQSIVEDEISEIDLTDEIDSRVERALEDLDHEEAVDEALSNSNLLSYIDDEELNDRIESLGFLGAEDLERDFAKRSDLESCCRAVEEIEHTMRRGFWGRLRWLITGS